ncbi:MAG: four helix bundle protein, partial [Pedobacter sp.]
EDHQGSVCSSVGEAYKKRKYPRHFVSKLTDADMENGETQVWPDVALSSKYITIERHKALDEQCEEISRLLQYMINNPDKFS